ncbi:hypothetical protein [Enterococcus thailandicus]|uniref:hypothetical protein n=1 Tax=Enterococcus thailandicus TaxID=417368 RepID=UPI00289064D9|nr:hypothetical protein [Enterococcus thailandicus]MDG3374531.1 hypothetical protein [Vibrio parahaemolyticus]MDT2751923.1 hypothetical protein [Enterococcus thailandicus]MDT2776064.1 hypothetical protein [Enterococcus thailandicus]
MRYDTEVTFIIEKDGYYDPDLGGHVEPTLDKKIKLANVTDLGTDRSKALFGNIKEGAKVIRLLRPYTKEWDYVLIFNKLRNKTEKFEIITERSLRLKNTFIVQEVASGG